MAVLEPQTVKEFISTTWNEEVIPKISEFVAIENVSPMFLTDETREHATAEQDRAMQLLVDWVKSRTVKGLSMELIEEPNRTPLLYIEISPSDGVDVSKSGTILMYGHMDKQPPFVGWEPDLGPYKPVIRDGKLYGRGGADDGYACFAAIVSLEAVQRQGAKHGRIVLLIEACEESGSPDLPYYIKNLEDRIGKPNLVVCLDSGCGNYEQLWMTSSLRGILVGRLRVEIISEGVHSGDASGVVPDTFRIARQLLDRIEDPKTGAITFPPLCCKVPEKTLEQVSAAAQVLGTEGLISCFPFIPNAEPTISDDLKHSDRLTELALNRWWRSQLTVTGASGLPDASNAGNVLRPSTTLALSIRLPPNLPTDEVEKLLHDELTRDPPYGAKVSFECGDIGTGWAASTIAPWLESAANSASNEFYGKPMCVLGEGGSIPFMAMLGEMYPLAQFLVIGVLGPNSNAHGPNEFLDIDYSAKLTMCISHVVAEHCASNVEEALMNEPAAQDSKKAKNAKVVGRRSDGTKA